MGEKKKYSWCYKRDVVTLEEDEKNNNNVLGAHSVQSIYIQIKIMAIIFLGI